MRTFFTTIFLLIACVASVSAETLEISKNKLISYSDVGDGAPLILIHAFPTDHSLWDVQQEKLKKYFRVITLDLWGFGKSSPVDGKAVTMYEYANEVKSLMDKLHIKNATIGGESMGGYIALALLEKYPDQVAGLILSNTQSIADDAATKEKREATANDVLLHGTSKLIDGFLSKAISSEASTQTKTFLRRMLQVQPATAMASALRGMSIRHDTSSLLAGSSKQILIITSDHDEVISPTQSQNMHALAKNSKLVIIKNAGHLSSLEQPDEWNQAVIDMFYIAPVN